MDISNLMSISNLSGLNTNLASISSGLTSTELESLSTLTTSGLSTVSGISNDTLKTATESFSTVLKDTLNEVQETGTISEETQEQISEVVNVLQSTQTDNSDDNTAFELYKELFNSSQGRKNVQEIVQSGFTSMVFDSGDVTSGLQNMNAIISALESTNNTISDNEE